jgi:Shikimate 5'-dehydrogenase C-terminal domain
MVHGLPWSEISRQHAPGDATLEHIKNRVRNGPQIDLPLSSTCFRRRKQRFNQRPLRRRQIARIGNHPTTIPPCILRQVLSEKTQARADLVGWDRTYRIPQATDIIVNATSIGLFPHVEGRLDLDLDSLRPGLVVADVIPNPPRTQLIRDAEARGCVVLDGLGMLVSQGAISIRHWTGIEPELQVMRKKLEHIFGL